MKTNIIFFAILIAGIALLITTYGHLTASEKYHCQVTSTDKSLCAK